MTARRRQGPAAPEARRLFGGGGVALFGEMLIVGLVVTALSLALVTAVPALAAGVHHLRRHVAQESDTLRDLFATVRQSLRGGWLVTALYAIAVLALVVNIRLATQGLVPGGAVLVVVSACAVLAVAVVACRGAAHWRPGRPWREVMREAREAVTTDLVGSSYIVAGLVVGVTVVWMFAPLVVIAPGMIALALVAADHRRNAAEPARGDHSCAGA